MSFIRDERGQAVPFLVLLVVVAGGAALLLGRLGEATVAGARARSAADAAALAGAAEGRAAAERLANDNGGRVVSWVMEGDDAQVTVEVGGSHAAARARRTGWPGAAAGGGGTGGLAPAMVAALARAEQLLGRAVPVVSGYRSPAHQARLWANRHLNPYPVARPGRSAHQVGMAVDVPRAFVPTLLAVAPRAGLCQPVPGDPVHFEPCRWKPRG